MKKAGVMVLVRSYPSAQQLPEAMKVYEDYQALLKKQAPETTFDLLCAMENQLIWLERWQSRETVKTFYEAYSDVSDLPARLINASKRMPEREHYQVLPDNFK